MHKTWLSDGKFHVSVKMSLDEVDYKSIGVEAAPEGRRGRLLADFLTAKISETGGEAVVVVDDDVVEVEWDVSADVPSGDQLIVGYVSHLLQAGLWLNPLDIIASTVYSGHLRDLVLNLMSLNELDTGKYVAERDARYMTLVAPVSTEAWGALGMILLANGKADEAAGSFKMCRTISPLDYVGCKYGGIALTLSNPPEAVELLGSCVSILSASGQELEAHLRACYGMALLSVGAKAEAEAQFVLVCGSRKPVMTPRKWVEGGYRVGREQVRDVLLGKGGKSRGA